MKIFASSDHAGFALRQHLVELLRRRGLEVQDLGPADGSPRDYPDEADKVGRLVRETPGARGLLVCGSGIGMCMAANRVKGIRAVDAWSIDAARLSRAHNDANVLCLGARLISQDDAHQILETWLSTEFDGGRHADRVNQLERIGQEAGPAASVSSPSPSSSPSSSSPPSSISSSPPPPPHSR